jgi:hypothetical protein
VRAWPATLAPVGGGREAEVSALPVSEAVDAGGGTAQPASEARAAVAAQRSNAEEVKRGGCEVFMKVSLSGNGQPVGPTLYRRLLLDDFEIRDAIDVVA